jgi:hypothetical protein
MKKLIAILMLLVVSTPAMAQGYFSARRPWSADCFSWIDPYNKSSPIKKIHLDVDTAANTVTRIDEYGQSTVFKVIAAVPSRSQFGNLEVTNEKDGVWMLATSVWLGGYAFYGRYNDDPRKAYVCSPYYY